MFTSTLRSASRARARQPLLSIALAGAALVVASGCGSASGPAAGGGSTYVVSVGVSTEDAFLGYLTSADSLGAGATYSLDGAVELDAAANIFSTGKDGFVYVAGFSGPTITRWALTADGTFERGPTVSFANLGLGTAFAASMSPFLRDDKAYFADPDGKQIVVWNPSTMALIKAIPLDLGAPEGELTARLDSTLTVRADAVIANVSWRDDEWLRFGSKVRAITIDPATDTIVAAEDDTRANQLTPGGVVANGTAYFSPASTVSPIRGVFGEGYGTANTTLRLGPPARAYDAGFAASLDALVGGRPAGDLVMLSDDVAFLRVWHAELARPATPANWSDVQYDAGFRWWRWRVGDPAATEIQDQEAGAGGVVIMRVGDATYATRNAADYSSTTLLNLQAGGTIQAELTGPGTIVGVVQVRRP
jgi:hypothetical protein